MTWVFITVDWLPPESPPWHAKYQPRVRVYGGTITFVINHESVSATSCSDNQGHPVSSVTICGRSRQLVVSACSMKRSLTTAHAGVTRDRAEELPQIPDGKLTCRSSFETALSKALFYVLSSASFEANA